MTSCKHHTRLILIIGILSAIIITRVLYVNINAYPMKTEIYSVGDEVLLENCYYYSSDEGCNDYSVIVNSARIMRYTDFMELFGKNEDYLADSSKSDVVLIEATLKNNGDSQGGFSLIGLNLIGGEESIYFNYSDVYMKIANSWYTDSMLGVSVKPGTEYKINLVYTLEYGQNQISYIDADTKQGQQKMYLPISNYPIKKLVEVCV